jgi:hypothetical protein
MENVSEQIDLSSAVETIAEPFSDRLVQISAGNWPSQN